MNNLKTRIDLYRNILPPERIRLEEMKRDLAALKGNESFLSSVRIYMPFGKQYEYDKLEAWVNLYTSKLSQWEMEYYS